eukprot:6256214-Prymnesium_polylepis.1
MPPFGAAQMSHAFRSGGVGARAMAQALANLLMHPDLHGHAKARKQQTPSAASTRSGRRPFCGARQLPGLVEARWEPG